MQCVWGFKVDNVSKNDLCQKISNFKLNRKLGHCENINCIDPLSLNNIHYGKRCFILGTAPTIDNIDLSKLDGEITFGLNSIVNAYIPNYWVACANGAYIPSSNIKLIYKSNIVFANQACLNIALKCAQENSFEIDFKKTVWYFLDHLPRKIDYGILTKFSGDIITLQGGASVLFPAIQIAYAMGCNPIYLLGISMQNTVGESHYFSSSMKKAPLTRFDNNFNVIAMSRIKSIAKEENREIISATPNNLLVQKNIIREVEYKRLF